MSATRRIRVLGDGDASRAAVAELLGAAGFQDVAAAGELAAVDIAPDLLVLTGDEGAAMCARIREEPALADVPILCVVPALPDALAGAALAAGADDIAIAPGTAAVLGNRAHALLRRADDRRRVHELEEIQDALLRIQGLMAAGGDTPEVLRAVMLVALETAGFDRGSLIAHIEASEHAYVVAATEDETLSQFTLRVSDYPELGEAIRTMEPVLLDDATRHPLTREVAATIEARGVRGVAVFPVVWRGRSLGAILFRKAEPGVDHLQGARLCFGKLLASVVAAHLRHGTIIERLCDQTLRISRASYEAERRLRTIESLKEHFEASADGVVVLDEEGRILFVNGTAEAITGFAADGLVASRLVDLVTAHQRDSLEDVIRGVLSGTNIQAFDLNLSTTSGEPICVSVTTSTVLARSGAVILSFRDVTEQRSLEAELHQTKDFLQKLIDSTVDAIVAADMKGRILLFNPGAEQIFGFRAEEVVGRLSVWQLYPAEVARQVMRMLRSMSYGGVGKLEQTRREVLNASGELVPVNMTASIIYEEGREVATVGIFSDLRERIRMEQRLLQAQEKIETQERLAMVAQLAGAAAHELNQPLTSIMAYTQLIERQSDEDAPHRRPLEVILQETERMADIVKKIGRITRYETKEYVGSASIMDLDKSAASSNELRAQEPSVIVDGDVFDEEEDEFEEPTRQFDPEAIQATLLAAGAPTSEQEDDTTATVRLPVLRPDTVPGTASAVADAAIHAAEDGADDYEALEIVSGEGSEEEGEGQAPQAGDHDDDDDNEDTEQRESSDEQRFH